jgi:hypothetical protein
MSKIEFKRGDTITHTFTMPTASWSAGGKLFFTAKPAVDDDLTDSSAVINKSFSDSVTVNDGTNVTYTCLFVPADTNSIIMNGTSKIDYKAEFQWVSATGVVSTFPGNDKFLDAVVYADLRRATS